MIDAKELRIGNWVSQLGKPCQIDLGGLFHLAQGGHAVEGFDPIPLTPELLESVGFVRNGGYGLILPGLRLHRLIPGDRKVDPWEFQMQDDFHKKICYLHELQNFLFFAKGIELEIKL